MEFLTNLFFGRKRKINSDHDEINRKKLKIEEFNLIKIIKEYNEKILNQHNTGTVPKGIKLSKYVLLSGTGAPLDDGFIPYLNSGERVILFEKKKEGTPSRDRSSSSYDGITGNQKKRSRALSLHLQTVHKLFQTKIITDDEKFLVSTRNSLHNSTTFYLLPYLTYTYIAFLVSLFERYLSIS